MAGPKLGPGIKVGSRVRVKECPSSPERVGITFTVGHIDPNGKVWYERSKYYGAETTVLVLDNSSPAPREEYVKCPGCGTVNRRESAHYCPPKSAPPVSAPVESPYLAAMRRDYGVTRVEDLVVAGKDMDGSYRWCRRCTQYVARGEVKYAHGARCDVAGQINERKCSW